MILKKNGLQNIGPTYFALSSTIGLMPSSWCWIKGTQSCFNSVLNKKQSNRVPHDGHCFGKFTRLLVQTEIIYMFFFAGWEVCIVKDCDRGLENAAPSSVVARTAGRGRHFQIRGHIYYKDRP